MRTPASTACGTMASADDRPAHLKADRELINVASKLVAEVIERAKEEAIKRRKVGYIQSGTYHKSTVVISPSAVTSLDAKNLSLIHI